MNLEAKFCTLSDFFLLDVGKGFTCSQCALVSVLWEFRTQVLLSAVYECSFRFRNASFFILLLCFLSTYSFQPRLFTSVLFTYWFLHVIFIIRFIPKYDFSLLCTYLIYDENGELPPLTPNTSPNAYILPRHWVFTWSFSDKWLHVIYERPRNFAYWLTLKKKNFNYWLFFN